MKKPRKLYERHGRRWLSPGPSLTAVGWSVVEKDINYPHACLGIYNYGEQVRLHSGNNTVKGMREYMEKIVSLRRNITAFLTELEYACHIDEPRQITSRIWLNEQLGLNPRYTGSVAYSINRDKYRFEMADCTTKIVFEGSLCSDNAKRKKDIRKLAVIVTVVNTLIAEVDKLIDLGLCSDQPHKLDTLSK